MSFVIALALEAFTASAADGAGSIADRPRCASSRPEYGDRMEVRCAIGESQALRKLQFKVTFSGGHDDTMASLSATLNGKPVVCEPESKTELMGEFGEISIDCQFVSERATGGQDFIASVQWSHAELTQFQLKVL